MKKYLKSFVQNSVNRLIGAADLPKRLEEDLGKMSNEVACINQAIQQLLARSYRESIQPKPPLPNLVDTEMRCFSQNGEDGILLYLFSLVGVTNKNVVEICAGNGVECNAANLIINRGWRGLLVDGDERKLALGRRFYANCQDTFSQPPTLVSSWITAENVNALVSENGFGGDIDLLSLDLDGMDYWIWKALTCVRPRAVILEYNSRWGPERAVTLPYKADFRMDWDRHPWCSGASLSAFVKLGRERGYRLVGTNRLGFNAVFLRDDTGVEVFPEISATEAFARNPIGRSWTPDWLPSPDERPEWWHDALEV